MGVVLSTFKSPQTGSVYLVAAEVTDEVLVCFRNLGDGTCRVRIQGPKAFLEATRAQLPASWGHVKDGDHLSVVVAEASLPYAVGDAMRAIVTVVAGGAEEAGEAEEDE
jgi:hypothetical protein